MPKKNKKKSLKARKKDPRFSTIGGILLCLLSLYLLVALVSYLFTWQTDQSEVFKLSWRMLLHKDLVVANWLGRLGAFISHGLIYWGFGLASFSLVFLLGFEGIKRLTFNNWDRIPKWRNCFLVLLILPIILEVLLNGLNFPSGGAYGKAVTYWLNNFLGNIGLYLFLISVLGIVFVWLFNPNIFSFQFSNLLTNFNWSLPRFKPIQLPLWLKSSSQNPLAIINNKTEKVKGNLKVEKSDFLGSTELDLDLSDTPTKADKKSDFGGHKLEIESFTPVESSVEQSEDLIEDIRLEKLRVEAENETDLDPYDPTLELRSFSPPPFELLDEYADGKIEVDRKELEANKDQIIETLSNYKIQITKIRATVGPTVTLYEIVPAPGVRISKIKNLEDDIALSLSALGIRIIAPIPGKGTIGIEVPNRNKQIVSLREIIESDKFQHAKMDLPIALGKTIANEVFVADLAKMPHLLIAGATGQGKSVGINSIIVSLLYKKHPSQVKLVLVDPKKVELFPYSLLKDHYLGFLPGQEEPILTETKKVIHTLNSMCIEMDERYDLLKKAKARNIKEYNTKFVSRRLNPQNGHKFLPFIILIIDEFADLIMTAGKEVEMPIARLAQLARATGIHLIIATQRPSVNIITGIIKANFPARLAYKVTSKVDSRTILDSGGADQLIGRGDMLLSVGGSTVRLQGTFVDTPEVERVIDHISEQKGYPTPFYLPEYVGEDGDTEIGSGFKLSDLDDNFESAAMLVVGSQHGSTSMIQRRLKLGYNRAGRIMDQLEALGIVGAAQGSKPREVLMYSEAELEKYLSDLKTKV